MHDLGQEVRQFVEALLRRRAEPAYANTDFSDHLNLIESGMVDSIGFIELLAATEAHFHVDVHFEDEEPSYFMTLGGFVSCVVASVESNLSAGTSNQAG